MKTAAIILNHNLPDYTDMLYESLKPYERQDYDLFILDNGSSKEGMSKYTSFKLDENVYFGGGFNAAMQFVLEDPQYDSLLFLNNDLTVHPYNFVKVLREVMFIQDPMVDEPSISGPDSPYFDVVSATFYNVEPKGQCHWKSMLGYGQRNTREVPFIDFQCPLLSRRVLQEVGSIDPSLVIGWGIDTYFAIICKKKGWKMGVTDRLSMLHHNSLTVKKGVAGLTMEEYCRKAESGQAEFFNKVGLVKEFHEIRAAGEAYKL